MQHETRTQLFENYKKEILENNASIENIIVAADPDTMVIFSEEQDDIVLSSIQKYEQTR